MRAFLDWPYRSSHHNPRRMGLAKVKERKRHQMVRWQLHAVSPVV